MLQNIGIHKWPYITTYVTCLLIISIYSILNDNLFHDKTSSIICFFFIIFQFLETISDAVQEKIHEAEAGLLKESEEKFFEEVRIIRY